MNKKQLLSITMLLSVVSLNAGMPLGGTDKYHALEKAKAVDELQNTVSSLRTDLNSLINNKEAVAELQALSDAEQAAKVGMFGNAWTAAKNGAQYSWDTVKAAPFIAWNGVKATPGAIQTGTSDAYTFAKANPTTTAVRTGAIAGAGYVVYRQAGNVAAWVKENPKKAATLVALAGLGYYKGDVALDAAKSALSKVSTPKFVNTAISYVPTRPDFVNTGLGYVTGAGSTVASYLPTRPDFVNTGLGYVTGAGSTVVGSVTNNPYTAAAYAATAAQGVSDYVGLGSEEETATETETVIVAKKRGDVLNVTAGTFKSTGEDLSKADKIEAIMQTLAWAKTADASTKSLVTSKLNTLLAELS